jgi:hypothetical protein
VVIGPAQQFHSFGTLSLINRVIHDENVNPIFFGELPNSVVDDFPGEEIHKMSPVDMTGVREAVEGIFGDVRTGVRGRSMNRLLWAKTRVKSF